MASPSSEPKGVYPLPSGNFSVQKQAAPKSRDQKRYGTYTTREEAVDVARFVDAELKAGRVPILPDALLSPRPAVQFSGVYEAWVADMIATKVRLETSSFRQATKALERHVLPSLGPLDVPSITWRLLQQLATDIRSGVPADAKHGRKARRPITTGSSRHIMCNVRKILEFYLREYTNGSDQTVQALIYAVSNLDYRRSGRNGGDDRQRPDPAKPNFRPRTPTELFEIGEHLRSCNRFPFFAASMLGLRVSEAYGVAIGSMDFENRTVLIWEQGGDVTVGTDGVRRHRRQWTKTETSTRELPMPELFADFAKKYIAHFHGPAQLEPGGPDYRPETPVAVGRSGQPIKCGAEVFRQDLARAIALVDGETVETRYGYSEIHAEEAKFLPQGIRKSFNSWCLSNVVHGERRSVPMRALLAFMGHKNSSEARASDDFASRVNAQHYQFPFPDELRVIANAVSRAYEARYPTGIPVLGSLSLELELLVTVGYGDICAELGISVPELQSRLREKEIRPLAGFNSNEGHRYRPSVIEALRPEVDADHDTTMSLAQAVAATGRHPQALLQFVSSGRLRATRRHDTWFFHPEDLAVVDSLPEQGWVPTDRLLVTIREAAKKMKVSMEDVEDLVVSGALAASTDEVGRVWVSHEDVRAFRISLRSDGEEFVTIDNAAEILGISREGVRSLLNKGRSHLIAKSQSGRTMIDVKSIEAELVRRAPAPAGSRTVVDVAKELGVNYTTVRRRLDRLGLPVVSVGRCIYVPRESFAALAGSPQLVDNS